MNVDQILEAENFQPSSIPEITKIITNLKQSNSVDLDNIPTTMLKSNINILAPILSNLINKSLQWGSSPSLSKELKYCPYLKIKSNLIKQIIPSNIYPTCHQQSYEKVFYNRLYNYFSVKPYYHHLNLISDLVRAPNMLY